MKNGENSFAATCRDVDQARLGVKLQRIYTQSNGLSCNDLSCCGVQYRQKARPRRLRLRATSAPDENALMHPVHVHAAGLTADWKHSPVLQDLHAHRIDLERVAFVLDI